MSAPYTFDPEPMQWSAAGRDGPRQGEPWVLHLAAGAVFTAGCLLLRLARRLERGAR